MFVVLSFFSTVHLIKQESDRTSVINKIKQRNEMLCRLHCLKFEKDVNLVLTPSLFVVCSVYRPEALVPVSIDKIPDISNKILCSIVLPG